jgi:hypothetical protein
MRKLRMWPAQLVIFVVRENDGTARPMTDVEGSPRQSFFLSRVAASADQIEVSGVAFVAI